MNRKLGSGQPRVVLILQARMGSTRLPGKSMMDLAGAPLLARILERVKRCQMVDQIVVATTDKPQDDVLEELTRDSGVEVFRGSENDLVDRYYRAAEAFRADVVGRLPADNPLPEPAEIDRIVRYHLTGQSEFSSNLAQVFGNGYPDGIGAEMVNMKALEEVWRTADDPYIREHLHLSFFNYQSQTAVQPEKYRVGTVECPVEFRRPTLVLDVNTAEQYEFIRKLYEYLYPRKPQFHIVDVIDWYDKIYQCGQNGSGD